VPAASDWWLESSPGGGVVGVSLVLQPMQRVRPAMSQSTKAAPKHRQQLEITSRGSGYRSRLARANYSGFLRGPSDGGIPGPSSSSGGPMYVPVASNTAAE
jgi:hypothetical protein